MKKIIKNEYVDIVVDISKKKQRVSLISGELTRSSITEILKAFYYPPFDCKYNRIFKIRVDPETANFLLFMCWCSELPEDENDIEIGGLGKLEIVDSKKRLYEVICVGEKDGTS